MDAVSNSNLSKRGVNFHWMNAAYITGWSTVDTDDNLNDATSTFARF